MTYLQITDKVQINNNLMDIALKNTENVGDFAFNIVFNNITYYFMI